jgi:epoxyqueuosine reductase
MIVKKSQMTAIRIKLLAKNLGADLCGIAPVDRFNSAPDGFRPNDIYSKAKSVIAYAKRLPIEVLYAESPIPYTHVNSLIAFEVDRLSLAFSLHLQDMGITNVMIPSDDPYESWNQEQQHGQAILSMRHAGVFAGLGKLGKNNLLINEKYGNMVQLGAILTDCELAYDEIAEYDVCPDGCFLCIKSCPQNALNGNTVIQSECRKVSNYKNEKGYILKKCWTCRKICPNATGFSKEEKKKTKARAVRRQTSAQAHRLTSQTQHFAK